MNSTTSVYLEQNNIQPNNHITPNDNLTISHLLIQPNDVPYSDEDDSDYSD